MSNPSELPEFETVEHLFISNGAIVIHPREGWTGRCCNSLRQILHSYQIANPAAAECDRVFLLVAGEYMQIATKHLALDSPI